MPDDVSREIDQLLTDREKYATFIKRLESERTSSSERAYSKVRADYESRLHDVVKSLQSHSDSLRQRLQDMERSVRDLQASREKRNEELEEARLRRSVGEYRDDGEWNALEGGMRDALQQADDELAAAHEEIARLQDIIAQVEGVDAPAAAPPPVQTPDSVVLDTPPSLQPEPAPAPSPPLTPESPAPPPVSEPAAAAPAGDDFISLGDLVRGDEDGAEVGGLDLEPAPAAPSVPEQAELSGGGGVGDELAFLESLSLGNEAEESGTDTFSFLEQHGRGTPQTIICPHCSAANDPAEWYCTECGEELPAE